MGSLLQELYIFSHRLNKNLECDCRICFLGAIYFSKQEITFLKILRYWWKNFLPCCARVWMTKESKCHSSNLCKSLVPLDKHKFNPISTFCLTKQIKRVCVSRGRKCLLSVRRDSQRSGRFFPNKIFKSFYALPVCGALIQFRVWALPRSHCSGSSIFMISLT